MAADDVERKVTLLLEHGIRTDRSAAESFVRYSKLQRLDAVDYQHRIELLRMYRCRLDAVHLHLFVYGLMTKLLPLLAFLDKHQCAPCRRCESSHGCLPLRAW